MNGGGAADTAGSDQRVATTRRALLAATGTTVGALAGCSRLSADDGHAWLLGVTLENTRPHPVTMGVRIYNADTAEPIRNYRRTVEAFDERPYPQLELDCEWAFREPLIVTAERLTDGSVVAATNTIDTRGLDGETTRITFIVQSDGTISPTVALETRERYDMRIEACEEATIGQD